MEAKSPSPTILIVTRPEDTHGRAVHYCLLRKQARSIRLFLVDFPLKNRVSVSIAPNGDCVVSLESDHRVQLGLEEVDTLWVRRIGTPARSDSWSPSDSNAIGRENETFVRNLMVLLSKASFSVNDYAHKASADAKLFQLLVARETGFLVPPTLSSNCPQTIREFLGTSPSGSLLYKTFAPATWKSAAGEKMVYASIVRPEHLDDPSIVNSASLWQHPIQKDHELRITVFGRTVFAVRIDSQDSALGKVDWRRAKGDYRIAPCVIPRTIEERCFSVMDRLNICFGCFDIIVTPTGDYVFLEVNEMGQFLWIEERLPELPLLDAFCDFLMVRQRGFVYALKENPIRLADIYNDAGYRSLCKTDNQEIENE